METKLRGIVRADSYKPDIPGKLFLGAVLECSDGMAWVLDYSECSPYHALSGYNVSVVGETCEPPIQCVRIGGFKGTGHFRVESMHLDQAAPNAGLVEIGAKTMIQGRFERRRVSPLTFITPEGSSFSVFNDPPAVNYGVVLEATAYRVQPPLPITAVPTELLWIITRYSADDLWKWRKRRSHLERTN